MAHNAAAPGGLGAQQVGRVAGIADAARPGRRAAAGPTPRDPWAGVNVNHSIGKKPSSSVATKGKATGKKYIVKESELTGDKEIDQRIRDYVESLNDIEEARMDYLELKADGADKKELAGKFLSIKAMVSAAKKVLKAIRRLGANPQKLPGSFFKEPK